MTDTTPTPEAVERLIAEADSWNRCYPGNVNVEMLVRQMTDTLRALLARVDALTKERDQLRQARDDDGMQIMSLQAASGAVAEAMREAVWAKIEESMSITTREDEALAADMRDEIRAIPIPPDAAAALAEDRKRVREEERAEIVARLDRYCVDQDLQPATGWTDAFIAAWNIGGLDHLFAAKAAILARKEDTDHDHR